MVGDPLRFAVRICGRNRLFAIAAVVSIALAVGANAAIFSIVNAIWLRPPPVQDPERLVVPYRPVVHSVGGEVLDYFLAPAIPDLRRLNAFSAVSFEVNTSWLMNLWEPSVRLSDGDSRLSTAIVASDYFSTLGVKVRGREFTPDDERTTDDVAGVISDAFWRSVLRSNPAAIGSTLSTTSGSIRIVGIAPPGFRGPRLGDERDMWITLGGLGRFSDIGPVERVERFMPVTAYGRLRPGVSIQAAEAEARTVLDRRTTLRSLTELSFPLRSTGDLAGQAAVVRVLWAAALMVLVLGSANLAALVIARAEARRHELSIRRCLGAGPRRLLLDAAAEAAVLCVLGFAGGLLVRQWLLGAIGEFNVPAGITIASTNPSLDWRVLLFGGAIAALATAIAVGGALLTLRRPDLSHLLATSASTGSRRAVRLRQILLAAHVAVCTALLGCGLALTWNVYQAMRTDLGYDRNELLFVSVRPRLAEYQGRGGDDLPRNLAAAMERALESVRALPNVRGASRGGELLGGDQGAYERGLTAGGRDVRMSVAVKSVGAGYLTTIGARFIEGRDIRERDYGEAIDPMEVVKRQARAASTGVKYQPPPNRPAAVIDSSLAAALWPGESAVGRTFVLASNGVSYSVVGVVEPLRYTTTSTPAGSLFEAAAPGALDILRPQHFVVRSVGPAETARSATIATFRQAFPDAAQLSVRDARSLIAEERARERMGAMVFSGFGAAAAVLAMAGIYGLVTFLVIRSRRELGIRAALGADARRLRGLIAGRAVKPSAAGALGGVILAGWVSQTVSVVVAGASGASQWATAFAGLSLVVASLVTAFVAARGVRNVPEADLLRAE